MKNFRIYKLLAFLIMLVISACDSDDEVIYVSPSGTDLVQASFTYSISTTDPNVILLNNTTQGSGDFTSEWDFGTGDLVPDEPGLEELRLDGVGSYTIKLYVTNTAGFTEASETVRVDEDGVCPNSVCGGGDPSTLKGSAKNFSVGTIVRDNRLTGMHDEVIRRDFNNITSEYQMKMNVMYPSQGTYDFGPSDAIVDYGVANGIDVHGHALIWHNATPSWVENFAGTDAEFEAMIRDYITTVLERYKGKVRSWDVVNEAIEDGSNALRNSVFRQRMGDDFIEKCYQMARDVDPDVLLFYNDYNMASDSGKRAAMFAIADRLKTLNLIDGIGAQLHISYNGPARGEIQAVVDGTVSRDLLMHFAEIDIRTNPEGNSSVTALSSERALLQKDKYKELAEIYTDIPTANKFAFTVWGLKDNESWLLDFWGVPDFPLLFDDNFNPKPAYEGVIEGFQ
ncbi:endo-1,4-beta-xylanase [uncultured Aquimarina sp.]|uniref:endo-1,4-beta-xylanase n=1 Tax=uncultured Aquimarina sp. TaxID=575652 RepID=UPI00262313E0|nr:endo-1,4-beta-xylanase [uncultured Aquimarina sp.]